LKILAAPNAGLGNRMQCIDSCIGLSRKLNRELQILWPINEQLNCPFDRLFEVPEGVDLVQVDRWVDQRSHIDGFGATRVLDTEFFHANKPGASFWNDFSFDPMDRVFIKGYHRFYARKYGDTYLNPTAEVMAKVTENMHLVDGCLGVHVRRTDHKHAIEVSKTEDYFSLLDARPKEECFFLSTDDAVEEFAFRDRYGDRVKIYKKRSFMRSESAAIEDAFMDMLLLSRCTAIIASAGSTFSACAAFIGNRLLHRVVR